MENDKYKLERSRFKIRVKHAAHGSFGSLEFAIP